MKVGNGVNLLLLPSWFETLRNTYIFFRNEDDTTMPTLRRNLKLRLVNVT